MPKWWDPVADKIRVFNKDFKQELDEFLWRIETEEEAQFYQYSPEEKTQLEQQLPRAEKGPIKPKMNHSSVKVMIAAQAIFLIGLAGQRMITFAYQEFWESQGRLLP